MPSVRSIRCSDDVIKVTDYRGTRQILASAIPAVNATVAQAEAWINNVWIPANITGYLMAVHIFSLNPLRATVCTSNVGTPILDGWWL